MAEEEKKSSNGHKAEVWTRVIGAVAGSAILALQGINISETNGQTSLIHRINESIETQSALTKEVNEEGIRIDQALRNQKMVIESMEMLIKNQNDMLELLKQEKK